MNIEQKLKRKNFKIWKAKGFPIPKSRQHLYKLNNSTKLNKNKSENEKETTKETKETAKEDTEEIKQ